MIYDDGFECPTGLVVVVGIWLAKIVPKRNALGAYEDYDPNKKIIHYSHLILKINIKLCRYKRRPKNKILWKFSMQEHEVIMNAL